MQVLSGGFQIAVPEQHLDGAQVGARFQQVSRPTVAQRVRGDAFTDAGAARRITACNPDSLVRNRLIESVLTGACREQVESGLAPTPVLAQSSTRKLSAHGVAPGRFLTIGVVTSPFHSSKDPEYKAFSTVQLVLAFGVLDCFKLSIHVSARMFSLIVSLRSRGINDCETTLTWPRLKIRRPALRQAVGLSFQPWLKSDFRIHDGRVEDCAAIRCLLS